MPDEIPVEPAANPAPRAPATPAAPVEPEELTIKLISRTPLDTFTVHVKSAQDDEELSVALEVGTEPITLPYAEAIYVLEVAQANGINIVKVD